MRLVRLQRLLPALTLYSVLLLALSCIYVTSHYSLDFQRRSFRGSRRLTSSGRHLLQNRTLLLDDASLIRLRAPHHHTASGSRTDPTLDEPKQIEVGALLEPTTDSTSELRLDGDAVTEGTVASTIRPTPTVEVEQRQEHIRTVALPQHATKYPDEQDGSKCPLPSAVKECHFSFRGQPPPTSSSQGSSSHIPGPASTIFSIQKLEIYSNGKRILSCAGRPPGLYVLFIGKDCHPTRREPLFFPPNATGLDAMANLAYDYPRSSIVGIVSGRISIVRYFQVNFGAMYRYVPYNEEALSTGSALAFAGINGRQQFSRLLTNSLMLVNGWNISWSFGTRFHANFSLGLDDFLPETDDVAKGGHWTPTDCVPRFNVAIIIPYRDRYEHLHVLVNNLIKFLKMQHLAFSIFVIEPIGKVMFNRALLMNIGFREAQKRGHYDCFIFHDVDMIPEIEENYYGCTDMPRHLAVASNKTNYKLFYPTYFGGIIGMTEDQITSINGFTNLMFGWGGEDDDIFYRLKNVQLQAKRYPLEISTYSAFDHGDDESNPKSPRSMDQIIDHNKFMFKDGLNTLKYYVRVRRLTKLTTRIKVSINGPKSLDEYVEFMRRSINPLLGVPTFWGQAEEFYDAPLRQAPSDFKIMLMKAKTVQERDWRHNYTTVSVPIKTTKAPLKPG